MTEQPGLDTPGRRISTARESLGLSVAELSERTKILPTVLQAIERDEYHKVSGALYIKSFLRTCAGELGLDADEVLHLYAGFSGELKREPGGADMVWEEEEVKVTRLGLPWRAMALSGIGLVVVGTAVMLLVRDCSGPAADQRAAVPAAVQPQPQPGLAADQGRDGQMPADAAVATSAGTDTLAGGWMASAPRETGPTTVTPRPAADAAASLSLPLPMVGGPGLRFAGGKQRAVVLRLIFLQPVACEVSRDNEQAFAQVDWPAAGEPVPPLPATGIEEGRVYAVNRGLAVYWGADDHLVLKLERTDGVEVSVNGRVRTVQNLRPGAELLLDDHGD
jgi:cytoskeletal protein RodZ